MHDVTAAAAWAAPWTKQGTGDRCCAFVSQVVCTEAIGAKVIPVAKEALVTLHERICNGSDSNAPGDEASVLRCLIRLTAGGRLRTPALAFAQLPDGISSHHGYMHACPYRGCQMRIPLTVPQNDTRRRVLPCRCHTGLQPGRRELHST